MSNIKVMDELLSNKIAAGEVVEKIVSIVKELTENSIDAKSSEIKIELIESGLREIKVVDNGIGMDKNDAKLCFQRHATSKLYTDDDLFSIETLGFRGEALPSIAAVSDVVLKTCQKGSSEGTMIHIKGGKIIEESSSELRYGTSFTVTNLFYNTPARLKHLSSPYSELSNVIDYVNKISLSYPSIKFTLINDGKYLLNTDGSGNILKVINAIYGKFGFQDYFLYDRFAQMQVTINGQLMVMMVIEALELNGIHVVSANTDGIIVKLPADKEEDFKRITNEWCAQNKLEADSERYKLFVARDINNYVNKQDNDKLEYKGALDPKQYIKDLKKGYDMPIVAKAVCDYFLNGTPVIETLKNHDNILDFCKTQNVGKQFDVVYDRVINGEVKTIESQRHVRFYVSLNGVIIYKKHKTTGAKSVLASGLPVTILNSLDDKPIEERGIDYKYYYNEAYKIINPIKLGISPNRKGDSNKKLLSGKVMLKRNFGLYNSLFDDETSE